jgi:hypothetical protein
MSDFEDWKNTAPENTQAAPAGFPEGMLRSDVNNSAREMMAAIRRFWEQPEWVNSVKDSTVSFLTPNSLTVAGTDARLLFQVGRKVRVRSSTSENAYAFVATSTYLSPDTTIVLDDFDQEGTPTPELVVAADANGIDAYFLGGSDANSHGIGPAAFDAGGGGGSVFVVPTADTRLGIQDAIDIAAALGGIVMLGDVTYPIDQKLVVPSSVQIWGRGPGQTKLLLNANVDDHVFEIADDAEDVSFFNMTIDGFQTGQTVTTGTNSNGINVLNNPSRIFIDRVQVQNCRGHGIGFTGTTTGLLRSVYQVNISNCNIDTVGKDGIHINDANGLNEGILISDCHVRNFGDSGLAADSAVDASGIYIEGVSALNNIAIEANSAFPHASFAGACIKAARTDVGGAPSVGGTRSQWSNIRIEGNQAGTVSIAGIYLGGDYTSVSNLFVNLTGTGTKIPLFISGEGTGVEDSSDCTISNATILSNASGTTLSQTTSNSPRARFHNCNFVGGDQALQIGGIESVVSNCTFKGQTNASGFALNFANGADDGYVTSCSFHTITNDAVRISGDNTTVEGCKFKTVTGTGIDVTGTGTTSSILGNRFDSVLLNIDDGGVTTKIGINSPNEGFKDVPMTLAQSLPTSGAGVKVAITDFSGVSFPYGANGTRKYMLDIAVMTELKLSNTTSSMRARSDMYVHLGPLGTPSDPVIRSLENFFQDGANHYVGSPWVFSSWMLVPAADDLITVSAAFIEAFDTFVSPSWRTMTSAPQVQNIERFHAWPTYKVGSDFAASPKYFSMGAETWSSRMRIQLVDEV